MSLDFEDANMCKGKNCTNLLTSWKECKNELCDLCQYDKQEYFKKQKEEIKRDE